MRPLLKPLGIGVSPCMLSARTPDPILVFTSLHSRPQRPHTFTASNPVSKLLLVLLGPSIVAELCQARSSQPRVPI